MKALLQAGPSGQVPALPEKRFLIGISFQVVMFLLVMLVQQPAIPFASPGAGNDLLANFTSPGQSSYLPEFNTRKLEGQTHRFPIFALAVACKVLRDIRPFFVESSFSPDRASSDSPVLFLPVAPRAPPSAV